MIVTNAEAMAAAGRAFADRLKPGDVVTLSGGLGAGKTLFCKAVLEGLGYNGDVPSPTFTIVNHYAFPDMRLPVIHADLYRLNHPDEMDELGLWDSGTSEFVQLIEWPEKGGSALDNPDFQIRISVKDADVRDLQINEMA